MNTVVGSASAAATITRVTVLVIVRAYFVSECDFFFRLKFFFNFGYGKSTKIVNTSLAQLSPVYKEHFK